MEIEKENEVLETVLEIGGKLDAADQRGIIDQLLSCIRLEQIESDEMMEAAFENRILKEREKWTNRIREALQRKRDADGGLVGGIGPDLSEEERPRKSTVGLLMVAGGQHPERDGTYAKLLKSIKNIADCGFFC